VSVVKPYLVLTIGFAFPQWAAKKPASAMEKSKCLQTWEFTRSNYPWHGMTDNSAAEEKTYFVKAARNEYNPANLITPLGGIVKPNDYMLMRLKDKSEVTVNARYFSDLRRADATRLSPGTRHEIGKITRLGQQAFSNRELLTLLMHYHIIQTLVHTNSEVCLLKEETTGHTWQAEIMGEHTYYTNEKNVDSFSFRFLLDRKSGEMSVAR